MAPHPEDSDEELECFFNERTQESTHEEPPEYSRWLLQFRPKAGKRKAEEEGGTKMAFTLPDKFEPGVTDADGKELSKKCAPRARARAPSPAPAPAPPRPPPRPRRR